MNRSSLLEPRSERWIFVKYQLRRNVLTMAGIATIAVLTLAALAAPLLTPYGPVELDVSRRLLPPSPTHWMGTDDLGMDIFTRILFALRLDLQIALAAVVLTIVLGVPLGAAVGYVGGRVDQIVMRALDSFQAFPTLILGIGVLTILGSSTFNLILVIALVNFPAYTRQVRALVLSIRELQYVDAARTIGSPKRRIVFFHVLPNALAPVYALASLNAGWAILLTAALGFLGLGVEVPQPELGAMIGQGARNIVLGQWWIAFFPGLFVMIAVLAFNLIGDGIQNVLDPLRR